MTPKIHQPPDRVGNFLRRYPELSDEERQVARSILQKASHLELAYLLADREIEDVLDEAYAPSQPSQPVLIGFVILALIAVAALISSILQW